MTNEAILKLKLEEPYDWIVSDIRGVEKGTIMKMSGVGIAAANDGVADVFAGIARREKIANDGRTRLALFRRGIFDMVASTAITEGAWVTTSGVNLIREAVEADHISGKAIGIAREGIGVGATGEIIVGGH